MDTLFTAEHIGKSFHLRPVLKDVSFSLAAGETVLLFGRNGSGKTTLLRILAGIMRPEKGTARLNGSLLFTADSRWRRDIVYLGHQPNLYPAFTARENLMLSVRLRGQAWDEETFQTLLARYRLAGREEEPIRVYSEGMLQRLGLIRLELVSWRLALLDEPSAALDVDGAQTLSEALTRWHSQGRTVFFTSHDLGWGAARADRALLLSGGTIGREVAVPAESDLASYMSGEG
ncbi:MAG: heme ABC exporter ATP-binding protein CcmA [Calditrichaeota bacterium]|nr:heme ABC exporter ATP-binding protein CcmA [Calditrichota bacterium]